MGGGGFGGGGEEGGGELLAEVVSAAFDCAADGSACVCKRGRERV